MNKIFKPIILGIILSCIPFNSLCAQNLSDESERDKIWNNQGSIYSPTYRDAYNQGLQNAKDVEFNLEAILRKRILDRQQQQQQQQQQRQQQQQQSVRRNNSSRSSSRQTYSNGTIRRNSARRSYSRTIYIRNVRDEDYERQRREQERLERERKAREKEERRVAAVQENLKNHAQFYQDINNHFDYVQNTMTSEMVANRGSNSYINHGSRIIEGSEGLNSKEVKKLQQDLSNNLPAGFGKQQKADVPRESITTTNPMNQLPLNDRWGKYKNSKQKGYESLMSQVYTASDKVKEVSSKKHDYVKETFSTMSEQASNLPEKAKRDALKKSYNLVDKKAKSMLKEGGGIYGNIVLNFANTINRVRKASEIPKHIVTEGLTAVEKSMKTLDPRYVNDYLANIGDYTNNEANKFLVEQNIILDTPQNTLRKETSAMKNHAKNMVKDRVKTTVKNNVYDTWIY